jgi:hypothetical protein
MYLASKLSYFRLSVVAASQLYVWGLIAVFSIRESYHHVTVTSRHIYAQGATDRCSVVKLSPVYSLPLYRCTNSYSRLGFDYTNVGIA